MVHGGGRRGHPDGSTSGVGAASDAAAAATAGGGGGGEEEGTLAVAAAAAVVVVSLLAQERPFTLYIKLAVTSVHSIFVISQNIRLPCCLLHSIAERAAVLMLTSLLCTTRKL